MQIYDNGLEELSQKYKQQLTELQNTNKELESLIIQNNAKFDEILEEKSKQLKQNLIQIQNENEKLKSIVHARTRRKRKSFQEIFTKYETQIPKLKKDVRKVSID
jgi:hypothetical protein